MRHRGEKTRATKRPLALRTIEGNLAWALLSGVFAFTFLYLYLLERRYRLAVLEDRIEERILESAIAERRAEADTPPVPGGMGGVPPTTAAGAARGVPS